MFFQKAWSRYFIHANTIINGAFGTLSVFMLVWSKYWPVSAIIPVLLFFIFCLLSSWFVHTFFKNQTLKYHPFATQDSRGSLACSGNYSETGELAAKHHEKNMKFIRFYFLNSISIGILQIVDGALLTSSSGLGIFSAIFSLLEILWIPVSIIAIYKVTFSKYIPISYTVYNILGWMYGSYLYQQTSNPELFTIPLWVALFGLCFGVYFTVCSIITVKRQDLKNT